MNIIGVSGSLRKDSWNTKVLHSLASLAPEGTTITVATLHGIPLFDGDWEKENGIPDAVKSLQAQIATADGILLASPEYNGGIAGVMKNAFDWMSRGDGAGPAFKGRPTALCGASPGRGGTRTAQIGWLPVLRVLGVDFWSAGQLHLGGIHNTFSQDGQFDEATKKHCSDFVAGFVKYIGR